MLLSQRCCDETLLVAITQGEFWLDIARCATESGDASLVCAAMCLYLRHFREFTFRFDDIPYLNFIGKGDVARKMELVRERV